MQTFAAASFAARIHACPDWVKSAARVVFVLAVVKGSIWLAASWLAYRGFETL